MGSPLQSSRTLPSARQKRSTTLGTAIAKQEQIVKPSATTPTFSLEAAAESGFTLRSLVKAMATEGKDKAPGSQVGAGRAASPAIRRSATTRTAFEERLAQRQSGLAGRGRAATARSPQPLAQQAPGSPRKMQAKSAFASLVRDASPGLVSQSTADPGSPSPWQLKSSPTTPSPLAKSGTFDFQVGKRGRGSSFGTDQRMEPTLWKKWTSMVDKQTLGAHYQYIVGQLHGEVDVEDAERRAHDESLAATLHRGPEDAGKPRPQSPRPASGAAFSDRALRLREGRGARTALQHDESSRTAWGKQSKCACTVCVPGESRPAGVPSHCLQKNQAMRCTVDVPGPQRESDSVSPAHRRVDSSGLSASLSHDLLMTPGAPPQETEAALGKFFGRRAKSPPPCSPGAGTILTHRSLVEDSVPAAGNHDQELAAKEISDRRGRLRQSSPSTARGGVAIAVSPRQGDPAPESKIAARRGEGAFHAGFTEQSARATTHFNQAIFRFSDPALARGRSQPPPCLDRAAAGKTTGEFGNHMWRAASPVTMEGKAESRVVPGYSETVADKSRWHRNSSGRLCEVLSQERCEQLFVAESERRKQADPKFAQLCKVSQETMEWTKLAVDTIKHHNGHRSDNFRTTMEWVEAD